MTQFMLSHPEILGIDTETVSGYARMISDGRRVERVESFDEIVKFIEPLYGKTLFAWNMDFDAQAILKYLSMDELTELYNEGKIKIGKQSIKYRRSKYLTINKRTIFDLCQFYNSSLDKASEKYLNKRKQNSSIIESFKTKENNTDDYLTCYWKIMSDYCKSDAYLTELLGVMASNVFEAEGISFKRPMSQASVAQNYILDRDRRFPKNLGKCNREYEHKAVKNSFYGGWFETFKKGVYHDVYDYDIVSAYPSVMKDMPHWYDGWIYSVDIEDEDKMLNAGIDYGWVLAEFDSSFIPYRSKHFHEMYEKLDGEEHVSTFLNYSGMPSFRIFYPSGIRKQMMTLDEYRYLKAEGKIKGFFGALVWLPNKISKWESPFSWIPMAFQKKKMYDEDKTDFRRIAWKILMNASYGKTAQDGGKLEDHRYASYITARTRLKIIEAIKGNENHIINIATDGIMSEVPLDLDLGSLLGQWELKKYKKVVVVGNGMYQKWDEKGKSETRARGLTNRHDFDMLSAMKEHKDESAFWFAKERPCSLGEVLTHTKKLTKEDLNVWKKFERKLDVNADKKRNWERQYESFSDFLNNPIGSKPWTVSEVDNLK